MSDVAGIHLAPVVVWIILPVFARDEPFFRGLAKIGVSAVSVIKTGLVTHAHEVARPDMRGRSRTLLERMVYVRVDAQGLLNTPFGSNDDDPVATVDTIQCLPRRILEYINRLHLLGRDVFEQLIGVVIVREAVDDDERRPAIGRRVATHP